ncbi:SRPBCC family protein [Sphaerisporangium fuscum]|uniref:SRPBCC family protein n=1 Tax=Sphaerisporangium fuscum TaxID=2835868 RepID=UPI001BDD50BA|nr:SRPBCC family protein [Sphaerisporangium fuscum]
MTMRFEHEFTVPVPIEQAWSVLLDVERVAPCLPGATLDTVDGDVFTGRMKVKVGPITVTYRGEASFQSVDKDGHSLSLKASGKEARGTGTASAVVNASLAGEGAQTKVTVHTSFNVTGRPAQFGRGVMAEVGAKLIDRFAANLAALLRETPDELSAAALAEGAAPPLTEEPAVTPFNQPVASPLDELTAGTPGEAPATAEFEAAAAFEAPAARSVPEPVPSAEEPSASPAGRHLTAVPDSYDAAYAEQAAGREAHPAGTAPVSRGEEEALDLLEIAGVPLLKRLVPVAGALAVVVFLGWLLRRVLARR